MKGAFTRCHPLVKFIWAVLVLLCAMWLNHPVSLAISGGCALTWSLRLGGRSAGRTALLGMLPLLLLVALLNPVFSHEGVTILTYLPGGNPLTLESIVYGAASGGMLVTILLWFTCLNRVFTADEFLCLFGRVIPALSLVLSMALRMVPRLRWRLRKLADGQRGIGRSSSDGSIGQRARRGLQMLSILVTWSLEDAVQTADSMKARGFGLPGRTSFSIYTLEERDMGLLWLLGGLGVTICSLWLQGGFGWHYYPGIGGAGLSIWTVTAQCCYLALCALPLALDWLEGRRWRALYREGETG